MLRSVPVDRVLGLVALVALAVLAGCAGLPSGFEDPFGGPEGDRIGWENGYAADADLDVTPADGYNESERRAAVSRTIARVEVVRGLEFEGNVSVEVIDRESYRNRSTGLGVAENPWNDQVWESLFLVGEDSGSDQALGDTLNSSVQGYYAPENDSIVLVSDSETPQIDRGTLSHELVHALQDQRGALDREPETQDRQLADLSLTEGEANLVQFLYDERCGSRWDCLDKPPSIGGGSGSGGSASDGVFLVLYQPYASGPRFVQSVRQSGGWGGVTDLYDEPPNSTEQVIHPGAYPDEEPVNVTVPDRSSDEWSRFDHDPVADTVGEASIYAMLVTNDVVSPDQVYAYRSDPSAGWGGDAVVPYQNESGAGAYVWETTWDTDEDAGEFHDAYRNLLTHRDAESRGDGVYVIPDGPFADAFRLTRDGQTVRIVNAPTRGQLDDVHEASG